MDKRAAHPRCTARMLTKIHDAAAPRRRIRAVGTRTRSEPAPHAFARANELIRGLVEGDDAPLLEQAKGVVRSIDFQLATETGDIDAVLLDIERLKALAAQGRSRGDDWAVGRSDASAAQLADLLEVGDWETK